MRVLNPLLVARNLLLLYNPSILLEICDLVTISLYLARDLLSIPLYYRPLLALAARSLFAYNRALIETHER
jgi:hypothetical protein